MLKIKLNVSYSFWMNWKEKETRKNDEIVEVPLKFDEVHE